MVGGWVFSFRCSHALGEDAGAFNYCATTAQTRRLLIIVKKFGRAFYKSRFLRLLLCVGRGTG